LLSIYQKKHVKEKMTTPIVVNDEVDECVVFDSSVSNEDASLEFAQIISKLNYKSPLINTCVQLL